MKVLKSNQINQLRGENIAEVRCVYLLFVLKT